MNQESTLSTLNNLKLQDVTRMVSEEITGDGLGDKIRVHGCH